MTAFSLLCFPCPGPRTPVRVFVGVGEEKREAGVLVLADDEIKDLRERLGAPRGSGQPAAEVSGIHSNEGEEQ